MAQEQHMKNLNVNLFFHFYNPCYL